MTRVLSADIDRSGATPRAINMMCESGKVIPGTNFSAGGGPAVPCAGAPAVYWGSPNPTWEGAFSSTLTLFKNLQLYANVDFLGDYKGIVAQGSDVMLVWQDTRDDSGDIYFSRAPGAGAATP